MEDVQKPYGQDYKNGARDALKKCRQRQRDTDPALIARDKERAKGAEACLDIQETDQFTRCVASSGVRPDERDALTRRWAEKRADEAEKVNEQRRAENKAKWEAEAAQKKAREQWAASWRTRCPAELSAKVCGEAPDATPEAWTKTCRDECGNVIEGKLAYAFEAAKKACIDTYVAAAGKGQFVCYPNVPMSADLRGEALESRTEQCSLACVKEGPEAIVVARERPRAEKDGPALVLAYKRCMVAADSTPTARKYQAYDRDLYLDYLAKADAQCRVGSRCDWVEKYSGNYCNYSP